MLEMFTKMTTFPGNDEIHQLETIYELIGNPSEEDYPEVSDLPWYELLRKPTPPLPNRLRETFESFVGLVPLV
jgi:CTD kinase subunit alpha